MIGIVGHAAIVIEDLKPVSGPRLQQAAAGQLVLRELAITSSVLAVRDLGNVENDGTAIQVVLPQSGDGHRFSVNIHTGVSLRNEISKSLFLCSGAVCPLELKIIQNGPDLRLIQILGSPLLDLQRKCEVALQHIVPAGLVLCRGILAHVVLCYLHKGISVGDGRRWLHGPGHIVCSFIAEAIRFLNLRWQIADRKAARCCRGYLQEINTAPSAGVRMISGNG